MGVTAGSPATAIWDTADGHGYWVTTTGGMVVVLGSATGTGGTGGRHLNGPIVGAAGF